jgi:hypothetical protein
MSNSFYNHGAFPSTGSAATSASMRAELDLVAAGFDKMPTLAGNANKFIVVNSTGTGLTQTDVLPAFTVTDTDFTVQDDGDNTRKFKFNAGSITTGNTRTYVMPDLDTTLVGTTVTQTLTNKTLTAPVIATIVNTGTLTLPTSTDTLVGRNTTDTLTNKTLTNPVIGTIVNTGTLTLPTSTDTLVGRQTTDTLTNKTISGASNTLSNIANGSLSNSSIVIGSTTLSLGGTMTTLAGVTISGASNTLSNIANASLTNSSITINGSTVALGSSVTVTATATNALTIGNGLSGTSYNGSSAVTIAINTGVTADLSTAQTFSNKTISGSANTLTNIANASLTNSAITIGSTAISLGATSLTLAGLTSASATTLISTGNQATSVAISAIGHSSGTVTVTTGTAHGLTTGDVASIDGVADYSFCGVYTVTVTNANVFTYSQTASGASSSGGFSTKLTGTWGLYAGGTGPSLANGPVIVSASSQMPALRVTQGGSGYALIVEDAANPDTSAFIISNAGDLAINTNKFTVAAASGNTVIGGTTSLAGNVTFATDATYDIGASGATRPRNVYLSGTILRINNSASIGQSIISSGGSATLTLDAATGAGAFSPQILFSSSGTSKWAFGGGNIGSAGANDLAIYDYTNTKLTYSVLAASGNMLMNTNLLFTDNTYNIGANGATRPANLFVAGSSSLGSYVGIGAVATSSYALDIQTDIGPQIRSLRANNTLDAEAYHFQFARGNGTGNLITMSTTSTGSNGVKKLLWLNSATSSYPLSLTNDGYAGINNTTPANWLHVVGTNVSGRGQFTVQSSASNVNPRMTWYYGGGSPAYLLDVYGDIATSFAQYDTTSGYGHKWSVGGSTKLQLDTNAILAMNGATVDSWTTFTSGGILQLDDGNYVVGLTGNSTQIGSNGYYNGNWIYEAAGSAANINIDASNSDGRIYMRTAPTGAAGGNLSGAWNYNLTMFSNGSGTTGTNSFGDPSQSSFPIYVRGSHVSGYGGVYFNSTNTAYYCTRSDGTDGQGLRMLSAANAERARLSIEPTASQFEFFVNDNVPIKFFTNGTARWTIDNGATSGNLIANSSNIGIQFNKSGALNNQVLNDYEYGTFTPTIGDVSNDFQMTESYGSYVKVGRMVYVVGIISWGNKGSASSSAGARIKGLPFAGNSDTTNTRMMGMFGAWFATNTNFYTYNTYEGGGASSLGIEGKNSLTSPSVTMLVSDISTNTSCRFSLTYYANS